MIVAPLAQTVAVKIELTLAELNQIRYALGSHLEHRRITGIYHADAPYEQTLHTFLHETYGYTKG